MNWSIFIFAQNWPNLVFYSSKWMNWSIFIFAQNWPNLVFYSSKWTNRSIETVFGIVLKENFLKYIFVDKKLGALIPVFSLPATLTSSARRAFDAPVPFASLGAQLSRISPPLTMSPPLRSHPLTNRSPSSRRRLPPGDSYPSTSRQNCNQRSESISLFSRDVRISFFYLNSQAI